MHGAADWPEKALDTIYASVTDAEAARRLPHELAAILGGTSCAIYVQDPGIGGAVDDFQTTVPPEVVALYASQYRAHDPWIARLAQMQAGVAIRGSSLVDAASLTRTLYYNDFGRRVGTFHIAGATLSLGAPGGGRLGMLAVHRPAGHDDFADDELARLAALLPHLRRACQLRHQFAAASRPSPQGVTALLDGFAMAAMVVDGHGRVGHANAAADRLCDPGTGLAWHARTGGCVGTPHRAENRMLLRAIGQAANGGPGGEMLLRTRDGRLLVTVSRLPGAAGHGPASVLLTLVPLQGDAADRALARAVRLFGLTAAEAEVAAALAGGKAPQEIADQRHVRISTVRTLLKRAIEKTDAANIRGLTRILTLLQH